jgi:hypothetical protein
MKRFTSLRTDYGKLKNPKATKSGQAAKKLTNLQKFKLTRYKFLDAHIMPRSYSEEMGKVSWKTKSKNIWHQFKYIAHCHEEYGSIYFMWCKIYLFLQ